MSLRDVAAALREVAEAADRFASVPIPSAPASVSVTTDELLREQRRSGVINIGGQ